MSRPRITWLVLSIGAGLGLWQLVAAEPFLPAIAAGFLLLIVGAAAGLRWGADSASGLIREMAHLNRYLAEQNEELAELNHWHLKQQRAEMEDTPQATQTDA